jgi:ATP-dependent Clp protease adaptor protein ClpS
MGGAQTIRKTSAEAGTAVLHEDLFQVLLYNDDHNTMEHVVTSLMQVFHHPEALAVKIMLEAHEKGRAIAEVESESPARLHRDQLQSYGLTATLEHV